MYEKELEILSQITDEEKNCDAETIALEYINVATDRDKILSDEEKVSEDFYEMVEGSAYYVEASVVRYENGEAAYQDKYINEAGNYIDGNSKYYHHGMMQCMLLDELDPQWKASYNFDKPLDEVIASYVK